MRLYVHWPFCASRCAYCDFNSRVAGQGLHASYRRSLILEAGQWSARLGDDGVRLDSIYLGGGTPSLMSGAEIAELLRDLLENFTPEASAEITVEVNPADWSPRDFMEARAGGTNRFSIGVQSLNGGMLRLLGRRHGSREAEDCLRWALQSDAEVSADLLCALPLVSGLQTSDSLAGVLDIGPHHISLYGLALEDRVPMAVWVKDGRVVLPDEDEAADEYLALVEMLRRAGYAQYEISNFSLPGYESSHNSGYWSRDEYLGLGAGAHSLIAEHRFFNSRSVLSYTASIEAGGLALAGWEALDEEEKRREEFILGMRTAGGVPERLCDAGEDLLCEFETLGLLDRRAGRISLTAEGMLVSNAIISQLMNDARCS